MSNPTIDPCSNGRAAQCHYLPSEWEYLVCGGLCYGTPSRTLVEEAQARGAEVLAYDGDGMWNYYRRRVTAAATGDHTG
jgi:hypothetical protein